MKDAQSEKPPKKKRKKRGFFSGLKKFFVTRKRKIQQSWGSKKKEKIQKMNQEYFSLKANRQRKITPQEILGLDSIGGSGTDPEPGQVIPEEEKEEVEVKEVRRIRRQNSDDRIRESLAKFTTFQLDDFVVVEDNSTYLTEAEWLKILDSAQPRSEILAAQREVITASLRKGIPKHLYPAPFHFDQSPSLAVCGSGASSQTSAAFGPGPSPSTRTS